MISYVCKVVNRISKFLGLFTQAEKHDIIYLMAQVQIEFRAKGEESQEAMSELQLRLRIANLSGRVALADKKDSKCALTPEYADQARAEITLLEAELDTHGTPLYDEDYMRDRAAELIKNSAYDKQTPSATPKMIAAKSRRRR